MRIWTPISTALLLAHLFATSAFAEGSQASPVKSAIVQKECGTCHMAFQPAFLPARSWKKMMTDLSNHFGEDASLSPDKTQAIQEYLTANAGDVTNSGVARKYMMWISPTGFPQRITENPAFQRKHQRFTDRVKQNPKIVTLSNCPACHREAAKGWFDDD